jgi:hypothetical protein
VYSLLDRGLLAVIRRGKSWTAELTEAGRRHLESGHQTGRSVPRRIDQIDRRAPWSERSSEPLTPDIVREGQSCEHAGFLWKPVVSATATFEEWVDARARVLEINRDRLWNPWRSDEREAEWQAATAVFVQWDPAEPGFRRMSQADVEVWMAEEEAKFKAEQEEEERRREARIPLHDAKRHGQLQSLREQEAYLRHAVRERDGLVDGTLFPLMDPERRVVEIEDAKRKAGRLQTAVDELRKAVGDPEAVVDERGWLPRNRREFSLFHFSMWRDQEIRRLQQLVASLEDKLADADRSERRKLRDELSRENERCELLKAMPPLEPADMCSECVKPTAWHEMPWPLFPGMGPCPAWPDWAAQVIAINKHLAERRAIEKQVKGQTKPKPLAVIPSGLSIEELMNKLTEMQTEHPGAIVRHGTANRWELWAPVEAEQRET